MDQHDFNVDPGASVPLILLANTTWWPCASRLAIALTKVGFRVSAIYPRKGHPLAQTSVIEERFTYHSIHPVNSLADAVCSAKPDLIVPCDDRAVEHLHELHARESAVVGSPIPHLLERSLGSPLSYEVVSARYPLLQAALELGLQVPHTELAVPEKSLEAWAAQHPFPWVLKADGSWGGHGTKIVHNQRQAVSYLRRMSRPLSAGRTLKRLLVDRDPFWISAWRKRCAPQVIIQSYVEGSPANCAVVCRNGRVLAGIAVDVVCAQSETGSATIVRVVDSPAMMCAAERLVAHLGLSGFVGFDFVIEASTGIPYLIEMNPRVTPLCHLQLGAGHDLVAALAAEMSGGPLSAPPSLVPNERVAYFPQAWHWDLRNELLATSFPDVPWEEPVLMRELLRLPWPDRSLLARLIASVRDPSLSRARTRGFVFQPAAAVPKVKPPFEGRVPEPTKPTAVVALRDGGSKPPLFILHSADGQLGRFHRLVRHLRPERPVYGILPQSLLGAKVALTRMDELAAYYLNQIRSICPNGPYHLLGYSFGGFVVLEMARQLSSRGESAGMMGLIAIDDGNDTPHGQALRTIYASLDSAGMTIPALLRRPHDLNVFAASRYKPQPFPGKISLFQSSDAHSRFAKLAQQPIELYQVPGDPLKEPNVRFLASYVDACLDQT